MTVKITKCNHQMYVCRSQIGTEEFSIYTLSVLVYKIEVLQPFLRAFQLPSSVSKRSE